MQGFLAFIFAPAFISLFVSLWVNRYLEAGRARRDHITKLFEVTREDIRRAVEVAVDYFATVPSARSPLQEAKVIIADREVRSAVPIILGPHPELANENRDDAYQKYQDLIAELTGGNFQEKVGAVDVDHIRRLTIAGAGLRSAIARMRDAELKMLAGSDWLQNQYRKNKPKLLAAMDKQLGIKPPPGA